MLLNQILPYTLIITAFNAVTPVMAQRVFNTQILVVGGGIGGTAAGLQAARLGVSTIIAEPANWLGGMLSAAGVAAIDGNHQLPSGLWREFREKIYTVYGGPENVATGWVSNTQFEPHVADSILKAMTAVEKKLTVLYQWDFVKVIKKGNTLTGATFTNNKNEKLTINAKLVIDATELGDVMANANAGYDLGMEAAELSGENVGVTSTNNIIQDLTYVAILKDFGAKADCTIVKPVGYNPMEFDGACTDYYINKNNPEPNVTAQQMLDYGKLPNNKYMLNWPNKGNDTYINIVEMSAVDRRAAIKISKQTTLRFIYFIQHQLGFKNLGLATDEFGTADRFALMPYHREGRRLKGLTRLTINEIANPFSGLPLYRTGIAVGDYPIDHHHKKNPLAPQHLDFYPVPSYNVPMGALIPITIDGLVVAEKGISVSNVVNGTTRLQPVVMLTGQAAGVLAALAVLNHQQPRKVHVRKVQQQLLNAGAYIMPYIDVLYNHPHFSSIQKIGATGILRGTGIPYKWANQTWFYPDSSVSVKALQKGLQDFGQQFSSGNVYVTISDAIKLIADLSAAYSSHITSNKFPYADFNLLKQTIADHWSNWTLKNFKTARPITRVELAVLLDKTVAPFMLERPDNNGRINQKPFSAVSSGQFEQIQLQKWIAVYPDGFEAWANFRRTDLPKLYTPANYDPSSDVTVGGFIQRIPYTDYMKGLNASGVAAAEARMGGGGQKVKLWFAGGN